MRFPRRVRDAFGMSMVELVVAIAIVSVSLLAVAAAGGVASQHVARSRANLSRWAAVQQQMETLAARGYTDVTDGSAVVQGYPMSWTVNGTDPKRVTLTLDRTNFSGDAVRDTLIFYLAAN